MSAHAPALPVEVDPLIAEAKRRARRRRFVLLACVVAIAVGAGVVILRSSARPGVPVAAAPICRAGQLHLALRAGGVAGGTAGYTFAFANTSNAACTLSGWPRFRLVMGGGRLVTPQPHDLIASGYSVKHPPPVPRIHLGPGETAPWTLEAADGTGLAHVCPTAERILVVSPGGRQPIAVAAHVFFCGPHYFWAFPIGRAP